MVNTIIPISLIISGFAGGAYGIRKLKKEGFFQKFFKKPQETDSNPNQIGKEVSTIKTNIQKTNFVT